MDAAIFFHMLEHCIALSIVYDRLVQAKKTNIVNVAFNLSFSFLVETINQKHQKPSIKTFKDQESLMVSINLLVLSREWMGMGVAGVIINTHCGLFPHSLSLAPVRLTNYKYR